MNRINAMIITVVLVSTSACATLTSDANVPVALSFSDGSDGTCHLKNKRGVWDTGVPGTPMIRRSDDNLVYHCTTEDGREAQGSIASTIGAKIVASAVFIDFGITDAITDKHREYPASYVIAVKRSAGDTGVSPLPSKAAGAVTSETT